MKRKLPLRQMLVFLIAMLAIGTTSKAQTIYALNDNKQLLRFNASTPQIIEQNIPVTGILTDIVGLDFRPATGQLYALGYSPLLRLAQLYTINTATGVATAVGQPLLNLNLGGEVGFDFNPTVDRIRLVAQGNQNYRLHPTTGALVATDSTLRYATNDVNFDKDPFVGTAAYTNSYIAATSSSLYVFDDSLSTLAIQSPPNEGILRAVGTNLIFGGSDLDIYFDNNAGIDRAYMVGNSSAALNTDFYTIDMSNAALSRIGTIGNGVKVIDIAVMIDRTAPTPQGNLAYALTSTNNLISFYSAQPNYILNATPISGLPAGYVLVGTDVRPLTGQLYALAYNFTSKVARMYTINTTSAALSQVGDSIASLDLSGQVNFDFNPAVDRIRLSSGNNKNYRLNPINGSLAASDSDLKYAANDVNAAQDPSIGAIAYTNSYAGSSSTGLFVYDDSLNVFALQSPPNDGVLNTIGTSGLSINKEDLSSDFDILFDTVTSSNMAFFIANIDVSNFDQLYSVNLSSGSTALIGKIGFGVAVNDIAFAIDRTAPAIGGQLVYATTNNNNLISFYTANPSYIRTQVALTALPSGYDIVGTDFRNIGGQLYALAYNAALQSARLFTVNLSTASLTAVGTDSITPIDLSGRVAVDFNPVVDRLRVVTSNDKNYRLNPATGLLAAEDSTLKYKEADVNFGIDPNIGSAAYSNARAGATSTLLYVLDDSLNVLATQLPPNEGLLNTTGSTGLNQSLSDRTSDLDIYFDPIGNLDQAYLVANSLSNDNLYSVDLTLGSTTFISKIGFGVAIKDIAVQPAVSSVGITNYDKAVNNNLLLFPNPVGNSTNLTFNSLNDEEYTLSITDITGRTIYTAKKQASKAGENKLELNTATLKSGIYILNLVFENQVLSTKMIK